jgi:hypothetical protein
MLGPLDDHRSNHLRQVNAGAACGSIQPNVSSPRGKAALAIAAVALAGCGSGNSSPPPGFAWLKPGLPPRGWRLAKLPSGKARFAYPPSWSRIRSDPGTVTAALRGPGGKIVGYLNATPQQGEETLANWHDFRAEHNREEGDRRVSVKSTASGLSFRNGTGSCVVDDYLTESGHPYREIACIVDGDRATTVVVGAAPPSRWRSAAPTIERAISSFET